MLGEGGRLECVLMRRRGLVHQEEVVMWMLVRLWSVEKRLMWMLVGLFSGWMLLVGLFSGKEADVDAAGGA